MTETVGADDMHAVSRIMRLPLPFGSLNVLPSESVVARVKLADEAVRREAAVPDYRGRDPIRLEQLHIPRLVLWIARTAASAPGQHDARRACHPLASTGLHDVKVPQLGVFDV